MSSTTSTAATSATATSSPEFDDQVPAHHVGSVAAFMIGFAIIILASILNAGGLNLTKLDHVRTRAIPKNARQKDWLRPLWLLGMILYILSQLIGSTLALDYIRAEYVAPLGSSSLIFNFLFASFLIGTRITKTDIYGTVVVIIGVIGIVLFGSINSGLASEMDIVRLKDLWGRANWILYFLFWSISLMLLYIFASQLEIVLNDRSDISTESRRFGSQPETLSALGWRSRIVGSYRGVLHWIHDKLEDWTAAKPDKTVEWTLGIFWACCGGGLAGGCLVFAKACVKLISGSLSHVNTGNQFFHFAAIVTFLFLAITAVSQIVCLNRGLKIYDSTLVVPVFYGVYTASGFLNSLIFNNEIDQYQTWTLCCIFVSILILIGGVVLLTNEKPEGVRPQPEEPSFDLTSNLRVNKKQRKTAKTSEPLRDDDGEGNSLRRVGDDVEEALWELGDDSDAEDEHDGVATSGDRGASRTDDGRDSGKKAGGARAGFDADGGGEDDDHDRHQRKRGFAGSGQAYGEEGRGLMQRDEED